MLTTGEQPLKAPEVTIKVEDAPRTNVTSVPSNTNTGEKQTMVGNSTLRIVLFRVKNTEIAFVEVIIILKNCIRVW